MEEEDLREMNLTPGGLEEQDVPSIFLEAVAEEAVMEAVVVEEEEEETPTTGDLDPSQVEKIQLSLMATELKPKPSSSNGPST